MIATWFVERAKEVIARDLLRDYEEQYGAQAAVRGQIDAVPSASAYYGGSLDVVCRFDDFTVNNAYNRVLLAAALHLQSAFGGNANMRREARRVSSYFTEVSDIRPDDLDVEPDRRSFYYADALALGKLIIRSMAVELAGGSSKLWTFLLRTPEAIEDGLRNILRDGLAPQYTVSKYRTTLMPSTLSIEPDLRFNPSDAVGDCKYKVYGSDWARGDLYQGVAFAAGARTTKACVISFATSTVDALQDAYFGDISVRNIHWKASDEIEPHVAGDQLVAECRRWLSQELQA